MIVICNDDSHKPNDIKKSDWVVAGEEYTVLSCSKSLTSNEWFFVLAEISPGLPYGGYRITRFTPKHTNTDKLLESELEQLNILTV